MLQGLRNLIRSAEKRRIQKFIHISSVLIYGTKPPQESAYEDCPPNPGGNDYGMIKLKQDNLILKRKESFQSIILCPPNIYGPYSGFTYSVMDYVQSGIIALVDEGKNPCNLAHVDNLVSAVYRALENDSVNGERFFIRDEGEPTWKEFFLKFAEILGRQVKIVKIESSFLEMNSVGKNGVSKSLLKTFKYLLSPEFREVLLNMPLFNRLLAYISYQISCLDPRLQKILRDKLSASIVVPKEPDLYDPHNPLISLQTRTVSHSINKAKKILGYQPMLDLDAGLEHTRIWMTYHNLLSNPGCDQ